MSTFIYGFLLGYAISSILSSLIYKEEKKEYEMKIKKLETITNHNKKLEKLKEIYKNEI